ncbi:coiled-coil domain-containing protein 66 [Plakobranchus ocellatus]|uniref:Coiled-coil domain-containing protein 66 n=1 Tax=Plakobranchus ocellatus TaxID=259542 RepID=A0AAV4A9W8_9GAST|nr:coiled-coil domain-containing protein 66 [Plakobranchus ocellatus]
MEANLSKKEIERRKWLAELDKQRDEQRLKKQMEKERDRAGLQDQWADRFVYHKTLKEISPRHAQAAQASGFSDPVRAVASRTGAPPAQGSTYDTLDNAPPAAMRSSMVVGDGSLNENRFDIKKAEEKRRWLQELEQQREEQRLARQAQKDRERQENNGTWADHYPTDRQKLKHAMPHNLGQHLHETSNTVSGVQQYNQPLGTSPRATSNNAGDIDAAVAVTSTQRTSSAPQPPAATAAAASEEGTTFLRGQGAFIDPVTRREQEEKRRIHLEYQAQVKAQIEEKERQKKEERERKMKEDMEEERKLQLEREKFNKQLEMEQRKLREKEEQRQRQIDALKSAMDEAQEKAMEEKSHRRIHHLQTHGHDVTQLKATYDAVIGKNQENFPPLEATPRTKQFEPSSIPGLGPDPGPQNQRSSPTIQDFVDSARFEPSKQEHGSGRYPMGQSYTKDPYVEDRVLTPSRFRNIASTTESKLSPRREFGTQTLELSDLQNILKALPEEIQIEYKHKVEDALREKEERTRNQPSRKVHVKSGEEANRRAGKPPAGGRPGKRPVKEKPEKEEPKQRLAWNQKEKKTVVKNSERDPFYQQKKEQSEARRARRERQLQYLQELNSDNIPTHKASRSKSRHEHCSPRRDGEPETVEHRGRKMANSRAGKDGHENDNHNHSPDILYLHNNSDETGQKRQDVGNTRHRGRSKSPAPRYPLSTGRSSPLIPTVRHRTAADPNADRDPYLHANQYLRESQSDTRYGDAAILPIGDGEFVPFMRTTEILDPARAEEPMAMSRENSRMERARKAYRETHNPAGNGRKVEIYQDREREAAFKQASQNPLINPGLVTDHPTARQDMILQQLSSLKQTLMQRQKELETYMSPAEAEIEAAKG